MKIPAIFTILCLSNLATSRVLEKSGQVATGVNENGGITANVHFQMLNDWFGLSVNVLETTNGLGQTIAIVDICKQFGFVTHNDDASSCLQLRIKSKNKDTKSPVAVIIKDTNDIEEINNNSLNKDNFVLVTIYKKQISDTTQTKKDIFGYVDVKDLIKALKWIHGNIHKYGGDEDHVILVGNQNTSDKINKLKNTKYDGKLFHDVRIQTGTTTDNESDIDMDANDRVIRDIAKEVGCLNINTQDEIHKCLVNIPKWRLIDAHRRIIQKYGGDVTDIAAYNRNDRFDLLNRNDDIRQFNAGYNNYNQYDNQNQYHQGLSNYYGLNDQNNQFGNLNRRDMRTTKDYGFGYNNDLAYTYGGQGGWQRNSLQNNVFDYDNSYQNFYDFRCRQFGDC